ncbi:Rieske 2Fe-2S domain-containing protein [Kitasatospora sp. NPDC097605]|uniref:Rieske 2Fe-2S domain-containing protein n=1 Tax=Kitasatospora sp. NPDC097605 TaxID=3157226 RepID=UPI00332C24AC
MARQMKLTKHWRRYLATDPSAVARTYGDEPSPLPYPEGWFLLVPSAEVRTGQVVTRRLMGQDVVVYRTRGGRVGVVRAHCPHLGAHLANGRVDGETIVCGFHHFAFDGQGEVVAVGPGYTRLPKSCRLPVLRSAEADGGVFVWTGAAEPAWQPPDLLSPRHTRPHYQTFDLFTHPQEVVENTVDIRHVNAMHGYRDATLIEGPTSDGHLFSFTARLLRTYVPFGTVQVDAEITMYGLGFVSVAFRAPSLGLEQSLLFSARPVEPWRVHFVIGTSVLIDPPDGRAARIPPAVTKAVARALSPVYQRLALGDLNQDFQIWYGKRYLNPPRVAYGEGPIGPFRKWAQQFYPDPPLSLDPQPTARDD